MDAANINTIGGAMRRGEMALAQNAAAAVEAKALLLDCLGFDDAAEMLARAKDPLPAAAEMCFERRLRRRTAGEPVAYILGWREFYGRRFWTTPAALIPRPETEHLVAAALCYLPAAQQSRVLDLGAGCGAIGITLAKERPQCKIVMSDVAGDALLLARRNAETRGADNVEFRRASWYAAVRDEPPMDVIVSNPPYVADDDAHLRRGDLRFEPPLALRGGEDGLAALARVVGGAPRHLRRGGVLLVEHGLGQAGGLQRIFADAGFCGMARLRDAAGLERVMLGVLP